jgi:hypothetical protein
MIHRDLEFSVSVAVRLQQESTGSRQVHELMNHTALQFWIDGPIHFR